MTSVSRKRSTARSWARSSRATFSGVLFGTFDSLHSTRCGRFSDSSSHLSRVWRCVDRFYGGSISGGNDQQGFPMQQGILKNDRVRLLMSLGALRALQACRCLLSRFVYLMLWHC